MIVIHSDFFCDDFERILDKNIIRRADKAVDKLEAANSIKEVANIKSMQGAPGFYRLRFGNYRIGFQTIDKDTIVLLAIDRRSVFYRRFPINFQ